MNNTEDIINYTYHGVKQYFYVHALPFYYQAETLREKGKDLFLNTKRRWKWILEAKTSS